MAVVNYQSAYGQYPPAYVADADGKPMHSWRVLLLPFVEQQELYDQYDFSQPWNSEDNLRLAEQMPRLYAFHGEHYRGAVTTNYLAVVGDQTFWPGVKERLAGEITDGHASTIMVVENSDLGVHWMEPRDLILETMSLRINGPRGINSKYELPAVVMADGALRELELDLPQFVLRSLLTANGGEPVEESGESWRMLPDGRLRQERDPSKTDATQRASERSSEARESESPTD